MKKSLIVVTTVLSGIFFWGIANQQEASAASKPVEIYLTRHGQTMFNINGRGQGG